MANSHPITGPYPDGDSRNITLTRSDNSIEPGRTGPREPENRRAGAPDNVDGDLPRHKEPSAKDQSADAQPSVTDDAAANTRAARYEEPARKPSAAETAFGGVGGALQKPLLHEDWNPAQRNSDDLSR